MAIKTEIDSSGLLIWTWSDENRYVIREDTGDAYERGLDPISLNRTYIEGDPIIHETPEPEPEPEPEVIPPTEIEILRSDVDYLAMMVDVELEHE